MMSLSINEELGGLATEDKFVVTLAMHLILVVKTSTGMIDIASRDDDNIIDQEWSKILALQVIDWRIATRSDDVGITDARIVAAKGLTSILHISDVRAMPDTLHHIELAELDNDTRCIFEDFPFHCL